ncbi:MAG: hypothetical protein EPN30_11435 [Actinomycetota bacterium]|nr:MAG: hypothetical protein EPN30_11435 [Actinomycetota bacterium]
MATIRKTRSSGTGVGDFVQRPRSVERDNPNRHTRAARDGDQRSGSSDSISAMRIRHRHFGTSE